MWRMVVPPGGHCTWASLHWANAHPMWTLSKCFMWTQFSPTLLVSMGFKSLVTCTAMFLGYLPPPPALRGEGRGLGLLGPRHLCSRTVGFRRQNSPSLRQAWALVEARSSTGTSRRAARARVPPDGARRGPSKRAPPRSRAGTDTVFVYLRHFHSVFSLSLTAWLQCDSAGGQFPSAVSF